MASAWTAQEVPLPRIPPLYSDVLSMLLPSDGPELIHLTLVILNLFKLARTLAVLVDSCSSGLIERNLEELL
jgi:hypothetical protein